MLRQQEVTGYSEVDAESGMKKLMDVAFAWDNSSFIDSICTSGFEAHLSPVEFKAQLEKSFGIRLSPAESGALVGKFATREGEFCIDGHMFLKQFLGSMQRNAVEAVKGKLDNYSQRRQKVSAMGQHADCLPKTLGR